MTRISREEVDLLAMFDHQIGIAAHYQKDQA